ncbi:unnamed protein product, partial [Ectocarpus sp. 12 AP-2014]
MEALVNIAYDRISEDIILLYDAMRAYNEAPAPRPDISAVIAAIRGSLAKDSEKALGHVWSRENSNEVGGFSQRGERLDPDEDVGSPSEGFGADDGGMVPMGKEPQLWEFARDVATSLVSDLAVIPLWQVKLSAVAHRGRLPELWPFIGYRKALMAIINEEGTSSLFRGWGPVCAAGLLRYFRRSKLLYTDYYWKTTHRVTTRFIMRSDSYSRHVNDPEVLAQTYEGFATRILWAGILHPFDLLATRMMTESRPEVSDAVLRVSIIQPYGSGVSAVCTVGTVPRGADFWGLDHVVHSSSAGSAPMLRDGVKVQVCDAGRMFVGSAIGERSSFE